MDSVRINRKLQKYLMILYGGKVESPECKNTHRRILKELHVNKVKDDFGTLDSDIPQDIHQEIIRVLAKEITEKTNFYELCKSSVNSSRAEHNFYEAQRPASLLGGNFLPSIVNLKVMKQDEAAYQFATTCNRNLRTILPVLLKIKDQRLDLVSYQLNLGVCQAITAALKAFPAYVKEFVLDSNNLKD